MDLAEIQKHLTFLVEESKGAPAEAIIGSATALDQAAREGQGKLPPRLLHFLQGRSYHKALAFLKQGDGAENRPACNH